LCAGARKRTATVRLFGYRYNKGAGHPCCIRGGNILAGGAGPSLVKTCPFDVITQQGPGGDDALPNLPFGSTIFIRQTSAGYLSQFGGVGTQQMMMSKPDLAIAASAGGDFCAYLQPGSKPGCGRIKGWGYNAYYWSQLNFPSGDDYVQLSAGEHHGLALKSDGSIAGWGDDAFGQTNYPTGNDYVQVAAGGEHSLALKKNALQPWTWR